MGLQTKMSAVAGFYLEFVGEALYSIVWVGVLGDDPNLGF